MFEAQCSGISTGEGLNEGFDERTGAERVRRFFFFKEGDIAGSPLAKFMKDIHQGGHVLINPILVHLVKTSKCRTLQTPRISHNWLLNKAGGLKNQEGHFEIQVGQLSICPLTSQFRYNLKTSTPFSLPHFHTNPLTFYSGE